MVKETRIIKYELDDVNDLYNDDFYGVEFTKHSNKHLVWPKAVDFAAARCRILQSAREAGAFRVDANGKYDADKYQATRTGVIYFKFGGKFYAAIDDTVEPKQNIVIALAQQGFESHSKTDKYLLPMSDVLVKDVLLRAEKSGRIVEATESTLELKTKAVDGKSDFGQNDWNKAILLDVAEPYAQILSQRGYDISRVWSLTSENLDLLGVDGNFVEVRPVGLGDGISSIVASNRFSYVGRACGVRGARDFSAERRIVELPDKGLYERIRKMMEASK